MVVNVHCRQLNAAVLKFRRHAKWLIVIAHLSICGFALADAWPDLILPDNAKAVVVADQIDINRMPTRIWQFHSDESPESFLAFYRRKWVKPPKEGSPPFIENQIAEWKIISRAENGFLIAVQVDSKNSLFSSGMVSIAQIEGRLAEKARVSRLPEYPKMPGSTVLQELTNHDPGKNALTVFLENGRSAAANRAFYKKFYERRGWVEIGMRDAQSPSGSALLMQKGPLEASFTFIGKNAKTQIVGAIQYPES
jgi:hypothetical protein